MLLPVCLSLTGCLLSDITAETAEIQRKSDILSQKIEDLSTEQQMIIYETTDLTHRTATMPRLAAQLDLAKDALNSKKSQLEREQRKIEANESYLKKHPPTASNSTP